MKTLLLLMLLPYPCIHASQLVDRVGLLVSVPMLSTLLATLTQLFLQECVVHVADDYVVVHKPAGVQVAPTVDNVLENVLACTAQVLTLPSRAPYFFL